MSRAPVSAHSCYRIPEIITVAAPRQYVGSRIQELRCVSQISNKVGKSGLPWTCGLCGSGVTNSSRLVAAMLLAWLLSGAFAGSAAAL
jgi:hypothetical protein